MSTRTSDRTRLPARVACDEPVARSDDRRCDRADRNRSFGRIGRADSATDIASAAGASMDGVRISGVSR
jgi:hypothetical protein